MGDESRYVVPFNKVKFYVKRPENKRKQNFKMETKWKQDGHDVSKERSKYKDKIGKKVLVLENGICGTVKYLDHLIAGGKLFCGIETDQKVEDRYGNYHQGKKLFECKDYHGIVVEENKVLIDEGNVQDHENSNKVEQKDTSNNKVIHRDLTLSSLAQFPIDGIMRPGVIKWIGVVDGISELMAGLEMEEDIIGGTDGTFQKKRFFHCTPKRGFFCKLSTLTSDDRFALDTQVKSGYQESKNFNDSNSLCNNYKKENGSRGTSQNNRKLDLGIEKTEQVSQFICNIYETPTTQNTYETPISNIGTQEDNNHASKKQTDCTKVKPHSESTHTTDSLKEGAICKDFLNGICLRGIINCQLEHSEYGKSYLWQFKEDSGWPFRKHGWSNVTSKLNDAIEEHFSDPNCDHFSDGELWFSFVAVSQYYFKDLRKKWSFRRLSTKSSVIDGKDTVGATIWNWYWQKSDTEWEEYSGSTNSEAIEKAFLTPEPSPIHSLSFINGEGQYEILFNEMSQRCLNSSSSSVRQVKRRPMPPIRKSIIKKKKLVGEANCSNEMFLYHGTASHLVEPICAQSFDPRLHGTHETLYGKGSYFAKNASYSHGYSLPDQDGYFYMFLAQVLVGQYVKGDRLFRRPPVKPQTQHDLYDSCVNDERNPSIFVVFELDQSYPRYLLKYSLA